MEYSSESNHFSNISATGMIMMMTTMMTVTISDSYLSLAPYRYLRNIFRNLLKLLIKSKALLGFSKELSMILISVQLTQEVYLMTKKDLSLNHGKI